MIRLPAARTVRTEELSPQPAESRDEAELRPAPKPSPERWASRSPETPMEAEPPLGYASRTPRGLPELEALMEAESVARPGARSQDAPPQGARSAAPAVQPLPSVA